MRVCNEGESQERCGGPCVVAKRDEAWKVFYAFGNLLEVSLEVEGQHRA